MKVWQGMPRRYLDYSDWVSFNQFGDLNRFMSTVAMIVFAVQLLFVFNFFYSIFKGRKVMTQNPWGATTLEWTTPIRLVTATGLVKFPKYIVGLMTMPRMAGISSPRPSRWAPMKVRTNEAREFFKICRQTAGL